MPKPPTAFALLTCFAFAVPGLRTLTALRLCLGLALGWGCCASLALAQAAASPAGAAAPEPEVALQALRVPAGEALVLDGTLSHPAWQRAPVHSQFVEKVPQPGAAPREITRVRVLFDEQALWVGVEALDSQPEQIRDLRVRHDGVNRTQDFVAVYVDAIGQRSTAQFFRLNAAGSRADGQHTAADDSEDFAPDFDWDGMTQRLAPDAQGAGGWTAVFRIPFASLRFAQGVQRWRFMVVRRLPRAQFHLFTSVPVPSSAASFIERLQPLQGVELPPARALLKLRPGLTLRQVSVAGSGQPRERDSELSLDLKWRPQAELVVDATLNPDFSQIELDVPQLGGNERFALFVAEKRPFFLESADLLRMPTDALYTRSVTAPRGGLRATWRGPTFAATAFALRDRGGGLVLLPGAYGTDAAEQPGNQAWVLRARHDDGHLAWGGLAASRRYEGGRGSNSVLGPDLGLPLPALPGGAWRLRAQWLQSRTDAWADGRGGLALGPSRDGHLAHLKLLRQAHLGETALTLDDVHEDFRHDTGFVGQAGVRRLGFFQGQGFAGVGPFNELWVNLEARRVQARRGGEALENHLRPGLWATGARNFEGWLEWHGLAEVRLAPGQPLLPQRYWSAGLVMTPAPWAPLLELSADLGRLADTDTASLRRGGRANAMLRLRPLPALELEPRLRSAWLQHQDRLSYRETALQLLAVWHLDARQSLRLIGQRTALLRRPDLAAGGAAASGPDLRHDGRTASLTYAWRRSAGSRLYVGASTTSTAAGTAASTAAQPTRREVFAKLEWDAL